MVTYSVVHKSPPPFNRDRRSRLRGSGAQIRQKVRAEDDLHAAGKEARLRRRAKLAGLRRPPVLRDLTRTNGLLNYTQHSNVLKGRPRLKAMIRRTEYTHPYTTVVQPDQHLLL